MTRSLRLVLAMLLMAGCTPWPAVGTGALRVSHEWHSTLAIYLDSIGATGRSGLVMVDSGGEVTFTHGFGDANRGTRSRNAASTLFELSSIAKVFTAVAIEQQAEAGHLRLDDSLPRFLESVPPDKAGITVRQLLSHTAGLEIYHDTAGDFEPLSKEEALHRILTTKLRYAPGTREGYSNSGYTLLAAILERVSGEPWQGYLQRRVLAPAGLRETWFWGDRAMPESRVAHGYLQGRDVGDPRDWTLTWVGVGAAGMVSTAADLVRFSHAIDDGTLVSAATARDMERAPLGHWALGWELPRADSGRLVMKGGSNDFGFNSQLLRYRADRVTIVLLFNAKVDPEDYPHQRYGPRISRIVLDGLRTPP
ncbi:MAG: serine hydrolase [Gemmatimonadetes bacterium]|nr:serine hydrolase [Gemmatimonadota bacterium]